MRSERPTINRSRIVRRANRDRVILVRAPSRIVYEPIMDAARLSRWPRVPLIHPRTLDISEKQSIPLNDDAGSAPATFRARFLCRSATRGESRFLSRFPLSGEIPAEGNCIGKLQRFSDRNNRGTQPAPLPDAQPTADRSGRAEELPTSESNRSEQEMYVIPGSSRGTTKASTLVAKDRERAKFSEGNRCPRTVARSSAARAGQRDSFRHSLTVSRKVSIFRRASCTLESAPFGNYVPETLVSARRRSN